MHSEFVTKIRMKEGLFERGKREKGEGWHLKICAPRELDSVLSHTTYLLPSLSIQQLKKGGCTHSHTACGSHMHDLDPLGLSTHTHTERLCCFYLNMSPRPQAGPTTKPISTLHSFSLLLSVSSIVSTGESRELNVVVVIWIAPSHICLFLSLSPLPSSSQKCFFL